MLRTYGIYFLRYFEQQGGLWFIREDIDDFFTERQLETWPEDSKYQIMDTGLGDKDPLIKIGTNRARKATKEATKEAKRKEAFRFWAGLLGVALYIACVGILTQCAT